MTNRLWEQALQRERIERAKQIHAGYVAATDKEHALSERQEAIMEVLGWIVLDNDQEPEGWEEED